MRALIVDQTVHVHACVHVCVSDVGPNLVRKIFSSVFNNTKAFRAPLDCWSTGGAGQQDQLEERSLYFTSRHPAAAALMANNQ